MTTATASLHSWMKSRDDYGRTVHEYYTDRPTWRCKGVVVRMPKTWTDTHGRSQSYLVNNWTIADRDDPAKVTYHRNLDTAKRYLADAVERHTAEVEASGELLALEQQAVLDGLTNALTVAHRKAHDAGWSDIASAILEAKRALREAGAS